MSTFAPNKENYRTFMDITDLKPRTGDDCLRIANSDELVVMENFGGMPAGRVRPMDHGIVIICTAGAAQFEYNGQRYPATVPGFIHTLASSSNFLV